MSMPTDREWLDLAREWQSEDESTRAPDIPATIRRRVQRFTWGLYAWTVLEVLSLSVILAFCTSLAWKRPQPLEVTTAVTVWLLAGVATGFALWNRRGTWRPAAATTRAFVELAHERCLRQLRGIRFGWRLLAVEAALFVPWIRWVIESEPAKKARSPEIYWTSYGLLAGLVLGTGLILLAYRRHVRRQFEQTQAALAEVSAGEVGDGPPPAPGVP